MDTHHRIVNGEEHTVYLVDDKGISGRRNVTRATECSVARIFMSYLPK